MNKDDVMYKCPKCDRLISRLSYMTISDAHACPRCGTAIIYFEVFKIDKGDNIYPSINADAEDMIKCMIEEMIDEEFEKTYRDGYSRGFEEGAEAGYARGYNDGVHPYGYGTRC